jgi:hypothetical protein
VLRLYAEAVDSDTISASVSAKGGAVVEVAEGSVVDKSIALIADPNSTVEGSVAFVLGDGETQLRIDVTSVPDDVVLTAYSRRGADSQDYIGQPVVSAAAAGTPFAALESTSADPFEVLLTAEVMEQPEQMGLAYGWVLARAEVRDETIEVVRLDGALERMLSLVHHAQTHAGLAVSTGDAVLHSEHVFNILTADEQDFNDANTTADRGGIEDAAGVAANLDAAEAEATQVGESSATANPAAVTDAVGCISASRATLQAALDAAADVAGEAGIDTGATVDAATELGDDQHAACVDEEVRRVLTLRFGPP